jgi:hypothetical protein
MSDTEQHDDQQPMVQPDTSDAVSDTPVTAPVPPGDEPVPAPAPDHPVATEPTPEGHSEHPTAELRWIEGKLHQLFLHVDESGEYVRKVWREIAGAEEPTHELASADGAPVVEAVPVTPHGTSDT